MIQRNHIFLGMGMAEILDALRDCLVRFFDSLFTKEDKRNEEVNYLRMELDKARSEVNKLLNILMERTQTIVTPEEKEIPQTKEQIRTHTPWRVTRAKLERESHIKAVELEAIRKQAEEDKKKPIEQLERELLGDIDDAISR